MQRISETLSLSDFRGLKFEGVELERAFKRLGIELRCPVCGGEKFSLRDPVFRIEPAYGNQRPYPPTIQLAVVGCDRCGRLELFDNKVLGLPVRHPSD
jgi:hypothetical protein